MKKLINKLVLFVAILAMSLSFGFSQDDTSINLKDGTQFETKSQELNNQSAKEITTYKAVGVKDTSVNVAPIPTFPTSEGIPAIVNWFLNNWNVLIARIVLLLVVLESIISIVPTKRNFSIFQNIREFLDKLFLFKNNAVGGGRFIANSETKTD